MRRKGDSETSATPLEHRARRCQESDARKWDEEGCERPRPNSGVPVTLKPKTLGRITITATS